MVRRRVSSSVRTERELGWDQFVLDKFSFAGRDFDGLLAALVAVAMSAVRGVQFGRGRDVSWAW